MWFITMLSLETERTHLRFYVPTDVDEIVRLHTDPDVVRYLVDAAPANALHASVFIRLITEAQNKNPGLGIWRVALKGTDTFLGNLSLMRLAGTDDIELGARLLKSAWGQGYSIEVALALLQYAFDELKLARVVSMCHPDNRAAFTALIATGFVHVGTEFHYEREMPFFVFDVDRWRTQSARRLSWRENTRRNLREARRKRTDWQSGTQVESG
jgi:RimJ/RimL family protein N-acetyltransferase